MDHVPTNIDKSRSPRIIPYLILGMLATIGGLATVVALLHHGSNGTNGTGDAVPVVEGVGPTSFVGTGPLAVGETTLSLPTGAPVEVWYPASPDGYHGQEASYDVRAYLPPALRPLFAHVTGGIYAEDAIRNVPVADGRYPVVVFSHGFAGFRTQSTFLTTHLASWGFVVAAPEHTDRDLTHVLEGVLSGKATLGESIKSHDVTDLEQTITLMGDQNSTTASRFYQHLDMSRIGAVGHSAGGSAVEKLAVADHRVKAFVGLAGASYGAFGQTATGPGSTVPHVPGLLMYGTNDKIVSPSSMVAAYDALRQPKRLISIEGAGHLVFSDICRIGTGHGGLVGLAKQAGLTIPGSLAQLGSDGCFSPDVPVVTSWPAIRQAVTAQLRWALGFDPTQAGLEHLTTAFAGVVGVNTTAATAPPAS
jgi:predicted dienelactone hydrolase